jgi:HSP20 family protein
MLLVFTPRWRIAMPTVQPASPTAKPPAPASSSFADLRQQIDRVFESFFNDFLAPFGRPTFDLPAPFFGSSANAPSVEVKESDDGYEIAAELPGLDEKDVELSLRAGTLTLKGEKRAERKEEKENLHISERSYGSFVRSFRLPDDVDLERIGAAFEKGVLTVKLPKAPSAQPQVKKIDIRSK